MKDNTKQDIIKAIPLQIKIGVTGRRNIKLTAELKRSIHAALTKSIQEIFNPKRKKLIIPITYKIITPLADGADRIVAVEAMQVLNAEMEVVLPMLKEEYERTFYSDDSIKEFASLLTKAASIKILISKPLQEQFPGKEIEESKNIAFEKNGKYIVDNCDILLAIWNGEKSESSCGTYAILKYAIEKKKSTIMILSLFPYKISTNYY